MPGKERRYLRRPDWNPRGGPARSRHAAACAALAARPSHISPEPRRIY